MLVLTPVPAHVGAYAPRRSASSFYSEIDYYDVVAEQAAQDYAAARARLRAIEQRREQSRQQRLYLEEAARRQAALDSYYREQSQLIAASIRTSSYAPARRSPACAVEELGYSVRRDEERRRALLARQREIERARALAEARRRQEAERLEQARLQAQWAKEGEALLALLGLAPVAPADANVAQEVRPFQMQHLGLGLTPLLLQSRSRSAQRSPPTFPLASAPTPKSSDKGKGKAVEVPIQPLSQDPRPSAQPPVEGPSFKEQLEARLRSEIDPEIQESLAKLYSDIFEALQPSESQPVAGPSTVKTAAPASPTAPAPSTTSPAPEVPKDEGAHLHRTHALPPAVAEKLLKFYRARRARKLSLAQIKDVEDALRKLESTFEFPEHLDFVNPISDDADADSEEPGPLAYTANNTPVHAYEHALNGLLTKLDEVESNGDLAVRGRRKEVVREVERALEAVERRVEESRERERERSRERRRSRASSPVAPTSSSDVEEGTTQTVQDSAVEISAEPLSVSATEAPEADTVSVALVDTAPSQDTASDSPVSTQSPMTAAPDAVVPEPDTVSVALVEVPEPATDSTPSTSAEDSVSSVSPSGLTLPEPVDAPEPDTVSVSLVDLPSTEASDSRPEGTSFDEVNDVTEDSSSCVAHQLQAEEPTQSAATVDSDILSVYSPVAPSEPSDATFVTAPSTVPSTSIPTPEAITRETSTATDATFVTADVDMVVDSPIADPPVDHEDTASTPQPATRVPSETPSVADEAFLLSSSPLADEPTRRKSKLEGSREEDELDIIDKEEVAAKSDSEWSDVDAA
ncbi:hypothetical protein GY45DRAFT_1322429 [Cubamyces sp. BRFM 1775]|nr:hypothetical protein GY45DRAFT_1322429 [Cubamyces sp. BRFM 1775]